MSLPDSPPHCENNPAMKRPAMSHAFSDRPAKRSSATDRSAGNRSGAVSGSMVVAMMVVFGAILTGILWFYWYYHSAPFVPLQSAIAAEFPDSSPRVDGGRRRMHKGTPSEIWIIMRVKFDVEADDVASAAAVERVTQIANEHLTPGEYDLLHIRLYRGDPERFLHKRDVDIPLGEVDAKDAAA
jgi:uncharacterized protein (DUF58 family)